MPKACGDRLRATTVGMLGRQAKQSRRARAAPLVLGVHCPQLEWITNSYAVFPNRVRRSCGKRAEGKDRSANLVFLVARRACIDCVVRLDRLDYSDVSGLRGATDQAAVEVKTKCPSHYERKLASGQFERYVSMKFVSGRLLIA